MRSLLALGLLVASTSRPAHAQVMIELSDTLRAATEELTVLMGTQSAMWHYRFGEFAVSKTRGGGSTEHVWQEGPTFDKFVVRKNDIPFQYVMKGTGPATVRVRAAISMRSEVERPVTFGHPIPDFNVVREVVRTSRAHFVFELDSAAAWDLRIDERFGKRVPGGYSFAATVTSGARSIQFVPVTSEGRVQGRPEPDWLGRLAHGFLLEEEGRPFAAVQYRGVGLRWMKDIRVWLPRSATDRERLEWAAILTAVMTNQHLDSGQPGGPGW